MSDVSIGLAHRMFTSIMPVADQIVVVFDEKTPPQLFGMASRFTPDVIYSKWPGRFDVQRNLALELTDTEYAA